MATALGHAARAIDLAAAAEKLRADFEAKFWLEDLGTYALALDGAKQPCRVKSSNAGQVLVCSIAAPERAQRVATGLLEPEMFSGWGVRTLCTDAPRFNPMSYHNGSIWPHDNALIAMGLARYGFKRGASAIFEGMFDAASHMEMMRFPELFCGFPRRRGTAPVLYPVACAPQAWASVVPFALLQACLGLEMDFAKREIRFHNPQLPKFLEEIRINDLELAGAKVNLRLRRRGSHTEVAIVSQKGDIGIKITQ
jgi:glycogen debranching enzyme